MSEIVTLVAVTLMLAGVVGSFVPMLPSGLLALAGVYTYWFFGDASEMGVLLLVSFTILGIAAALLEHFAGAVAARATGASNRTMLIAAGAGILLFFITGPIGILLGIWGVVFVSEIREGADLELAIRRAVYTVVGMLGSAVIQMLLTLSILLGFLLFVVWL